MDPARPPAAARRRPRQAARLCPPRQAAAPSPSPRGPDGSTGSSRGGGASSPVARPRAQRGPRMSPGGGGGSDREQQASAPRSVGAAQRPAWGRAGRGDGARLTPALDGRGPGGGLAVFILPGRSPTSDGEGGRRRRQGCVAPVALSLLHMSAGPPRPSTEAGRPGERVAPGFNPPPPGETGLAGRPRVNPSLPLPQFLGSAERRSGGA